MQILLFPPNHLKLLICRGLQAKPSSGSESTRMTTRAGFLIAKGTRKGVDCLLDQTSSFPWMLVPCFCLLLFLQHLRVVASQALGRDWVSLVILLLISGWDLRTNLGRVWSIQFSCVPKKSFGQFPIYISLVFQNLLSLISKILEPLLQHLSLPTQTKFAKSIELVTMTVLSKSGSVLGLWSRTIGKL